MIPSSVWYFDPHFALAEEEQLFTICHVASGMTFQQANPCTSAVRFFYWNVQAVEPPTSMDTDELCICGHAAFVAVSAILSRSKPIECPLRVRFPSAPFSYFLTSFDVEIEDAPPSA